MHVDYLQPSDTHTVCGSKGTASYYHVTVDGQVNRDAAWYYQEPKEAARNIAGHIAFRKGVTVTARDHLQALGTDERALRQFASEQVREADSRIFPE